MMEYVAGYWYPNDFANPVIWGPMVAVYSIIAPGSSMLFFAYMSYLLGKFREIFSPMLIVAFSLFSVTLMGPLADLRAVDNAWRLLVAPRILPVEEAIPGFSLMAFQGFLMWLLLTLITVIFILLYFSYPAYLRYMEAKNSISKTIYKIMSLGLSSKEKYATLEKPLKILALLGVIVSITWLLYLPMLFMQTKNFVWTRSMMLPTLYFIEYVLRGAGIELLLSLFVFWAVKGVKPKLEIIRPFATFIGVASAAAISAIVLQVVIWIFVFHGSPYYPAITHVYGLLSIALILYVVALISTVLFLSKNWTSFVIIASLAGTLGVIANRWNFLVKAQEVSRTGLGINEALIPAEVFFEMVGFYGLAIFLVIVLSSLFPVGFELKRGETA